MFVPSCSKSLNLRPNVQIGQGVVPNGQAQAVNPDALGFLPEIFAVRKLSIQEHSQWQT